MKIGLFGGTFNPVHYGHLINAQNIKEEFALDKILFIPSKYPVHKEIDRFVSTEDRFNMLRLAVEDNPSFDISRIEIDREDDSYFIITIRQLSKIYANAGLFLIIGLDAFNEIDKWKNSGEIIQTVSFIVMRRPELKNINKKIIKKTKRVEFAHNPMIDISSSVIRAYIRTDRSVKYLVPGKVEEYIIKNNLYKV